MPAAQVAMPHTLGKSALTSLIVGARGDPAQRGIMGAFSDYYCLRKEASVFLCPASMRPRLSTPPPRHLITRDPVM